MPSTSAMSWVVAPWKPRSAKTRAAASMISGARRRGLGRKRRGGGRGTTGMGHVVWASAKGAWGIALCHDGGGKSSPCPLDKKPRVAEGGGGTKSGGGRPGGRPAVSRRSRGQPVATTGATLGVPAPRRQRDRGRRVRAHSGRLHPRRGPHARRGWARSRDRRRVSPRLLLGPVRGTHRGLGGPPCAAQIPR